MADDLDAFFDEVSDVEARVKQDEATAADDEQNDVELRPAKKQKPNSALPRGVVVAAASSVKIANAGEESNSLVAEPPRLEKPQSTTAPLHPPPPPPLRPTAQAEQKNNPNGDKKNAHEKAPKTFTLFIGNLGAETTEADLYEHFAAKYSSVYQSQITRNAAGESKGYGFISFTQALECARAKRDMDQTWLGARPIRIKKYQGHQTGGGGSTKQKHGKHKR